MNDNRVSHRVYSGASGRGNSETRSGHRGVEAGRQRTPPPRDHPRGCAQPQGVLMPTPSRSKPNPRVTNGHRRRELRARVLREETHCGICGQPVDKTLHHHDPMAPEVDEIMPVSRGGDPLARGNTRLTHRICNQRRGNGGRERADVAGARPAVVASDIW